MSDNVVAPPSGGGAYGGPEMIQLLTPEGERIDHPEYSRYIEHLTDEDLRGFYRDMVLIRRVDTEGTALQRQGQLGLWVSLLGQEAAQIGVGRAMRKQDHAFPGYREHGVGWCRGVKPLQVMSQFRGVDHGGWDPAEVGMHLYTIVIGNQVLMGTGYAMGITLDGDVGTGDPDRDAAVVAFFGDGATAQGDVNESFVFAGVNNAPIVFFCQNNQWAISEPNERQTRGPLYQRANGFGFPGVRVDGNDVLASYAVSKAMLDRARDGQGPPSSRPTPTACRPTPRPTTRRSTAWTPRSRSGSTATRSSACVPTSPAPGPRTRRSSTRSTPRPTRWPRRSAPGPSACPTRTRTACSTTSTSTTSPWSRSSARSSLPTPRASRTDHP